MTIIMRNVHTFGIVNKRFNRVVQVTDTFSLTLKATINYVLPTANRAWLR